MPGPPVARIRFTPGCCMSIRLRSAVGSSIQPMMCSGAPAATAASRMIRAASLVERQALGWGEKMMALRVFSDRSDLKMAVEVGLVVGMIPAMMPMGAATSR